MEIKPVYRFEDIGVLDLRVCYNGEWYFTRALPSHAVADLLAEPSISPLLKARVREILANKGEVDFYDVYDLAYGKNCIRPPHRLLWSTKGCVDTEVDYTQRLSL